MAKAAAQAAYLLGWVLCFLVWNGFWSCMALCCVVRLVQYFASMGFGNGKLVGLDGRVRELEDAAVARLESVPVVEAPVVPEPVVEPVVVLGEVASEPRQGKGSSLVAAASPDPAPLDSMPEGRVAVLEAAIRSHRDLVLGDELSDEPELVRLGVAGERLWRVLDGR